MSRLLTSLVIAVFMITAAPFSAYTAKRRGVVHRPSSPVELDHVWLVVSPGAPERAALERAGFRIAPAVNRHDGQGTASVTVELYNAFLELLWPDSSVAVAPGKEVVVERFRKLMAWRTTGRSPIGIGLRRNPSAPDSLPFQTFPVRADWLRPGTAIELLTTFADTLTPRIFVSPRYLAVVEDSNLNAVRARSDQAWALTHPNRVRRLTAARVIAPRPEGLTAPARMLDSLGIVQFDRGPQWLLDLTFDANARGKTKDLRPDLPLIIHY
jgi:hypothetical protein